MDKPILYSYFRSSCSYRVRIALNLKGVDYETRPIHLVKDGGQQFNKDYFELNPMKQVPLLIHEGFAISQSMAIVEYIDAVWKMGQPLFPADPKMAARVRQICEIVNSGIQPHQNLTAGAELKKQFGIDDAQKVEWWKFWVKRGFEGLEKVVSETAVNFAFGSRVTAADAFIVPQVFNAERFGIDMGEFPILRRIAKNASEHHDFVKAHPSKQPDFE